jgi:divinyl protochlorophyllide a 8-vinyl-reductase
VTTAPPPRGRIGPNALLRTIEALDAGEGVARTDAVLREAGLERYRAHPPTGLVDEREVATLLRCVRQAFSPDQAAAVAWDAGERTARYLLANRIPRFAQVLLRMLPAGLAARSLLAAIRGNTWTFAGSARIALRVRGRSVDVAFSGCPLCRAEPDGAPACAYYAGTFVGLLRALVAPTVTASEVACEADGSEACRFMFRWD